jgi:hypothetical protein
MGRPRKFQTPDKLWKAAVEYMEWIVDNPLIENKVFQHQGEIIHAEVKKIRAATIQGFCLYNSIGRQTWQEYKDRAEFSEVIARVDDLFREQKFTGAAADLLNPNIIARDLGLTDKSESRTIGVQVTTDLTNLSDDDLTKLEGILAKIETPKV